MTWRPEQSGRSSRPRAKGSCEPPNAGASESKNLNFTNTEFSGVLHMGYKSVRLFLYSYIKLKNLEL